MSTQKIERFSRDRTVNCPGYPPYARNNASAFALSEPERFVRAVGFTGDGGFVDPFSISYPAVSDLCRRLRDHPEFPISALKEKSVTDQNMRLLFFLNSRLVVSAKRGFVAVMPNDPRSAVLFNASVLPTANGLLSKTISIDLASETAERHFVCSFDELKIVTVAILRYFGYKAHLAEFSLDPAQYSEDKDNPAGAISPYLPLYPYSQLHDNCRLGATVILPKEGAHNGEFDRIISFNPLKTHPIIRGFTVLNDYEASGIVLGISAQRKLLALNHRINDAASFYQGDSNLFANDMQGIVSDIRESHLRYPDNSVALQALVRLVDTVLSMVEKGLSLCIAFSEICLHLGIWEEIHDRFNLEPSQHYLIRSMIKEKGLRKKLLEGSSGLQNLEAAFLLGLCLNDVPEDGQSAESEKK
jgi:hypothetical protein